MSILTNININDCNITMFDGLYCLNDLHRASGGLKKHSPNRFIEKVKTQALIKEIEQGTKKGLGTKSIAYNIIHGGNKQGTYVCRKLVYAYCSWISAKFYNLVLDVFDNFIIKGHYDIDYLHALYSKLDTVKGYASVCGRGLSQLGKQEIPKLESHIQEVENIIQPSLFDNTGCNHA